MSPKGLVLVVLVGLCAAQVSSSTELAVSRHHDRLRHERGVQELLAAAKERLSRVMLAAEDAARASVETVWQYVLQLEKDVLIYGTNTLFSYGYEVNLTTVADLFKSDLKACVTELELREPMMEIVLDLTSCVSRDTESLKKLIKIMQELWATAQTMPDAMEEVTAACSEHLQYNDEVPDEIMEELMSHESGDESMEYQSMEEMLDHTDHDLADKSNQLLHEASRTMTKRGLWGFGRVTRCVRSVYSLAKSDMMTIPGQIVAAAANGFRVSRAASGGIQSCVSYKVTENMPTIISSLADMGTCMAKMNLDEVVDRYPYLYGLQKLVEVAKKMEEYQDDPLRGLANFFDSSEEENKEEKRGYLSYIPGAETAGMAYTGATKLAGYLWG